MRATLTYHSIDDSGSPISLSPGVFAEHLRWLTSGPVGVLALDDLLAHPDDAEDAVAVTFDDGFLNTRGPVESLLAAGVPATMFIVTGHVGGTNSWGAATYTGIPTLPLLDWSDLEHLVARGAMVGSHARSHSPLTAVSSGALEDELLGSREDLQARLGVQTVHVAYPYGDVDDAVATRAAQYFRWGHTTDVRVVTSAAEPLRLPRLDVYYFNAPGALEAWGTRRFMHRVAWIRARRTLRARLVGTMCRGTQS